MHATHLEESEKIHSFFYLEEGDYDYQILGQWGYFNLEYYNTSRNEIEVGGNRVRKIIRSSSQNNKFIRTFIYKNNNLTYIPNFDYKRKVVVDPALNTPEAGYLPCDYCGDEFVITEKSTVNYEGFHLQYLEVVEQNSMSGKTESYFMPVTFIESVPVHNSGLVHLSIAWRDGLLRKETNFTQSLTGFKNVFETQISYSDINNIYPYKRYSLIVMRNYYCIGEESDPSIAIQPFHTSSLPQYSDNFGKVREISLSSNDEGILLKADTTIFEYNSRWQPFRTRKNRTNGGYTQQDVYYAQDYINSTNVDILKDKHIVGKPIKVVNSINGQTTSASLAKYNNNGKPIETYTYESLVTHLHNPNVLIPSDFKLEENRTYNSHGRLSGFMGRDGVPYTYLWSYNFTHPVALIANASEAQVSAVIGDLETFGALTSENTIASGLSSLRNSLAQAQLTTALYNPGIGIKQLTSVDEIIFNYEYDGLNRLKTVKDRNGNEVDNYTYQNALNLNAD